ncbi:MAG: LysR substrate-binding domain-containing protein [Elsteraceae bacterium]
MSADALSLRQLRYFVAAVDSGSISQAAIFLSIAQPAVGQQIAEMEALLGAPLLARTARGVRPTEVGERIYAQAQAILRQIGQLPPLARAPTPELAGSVSLGLVSSLAARLTAPLLLAARARHPQLRLKIIEGTSVTIREQVNLLRVDLGLVFESRPAPGVLRRPLFRQRLFAFEPGRTWKEDSPTISLKELTQIPLVLPSAPNAIRGALDRAFAQKGLEPDLAAETTSLSGLLSAVDAGLGATVLPIGELPPSLTVTAARIRSIEPAIWLTASTIHSAITSPEAAPRALHALLCDVIAAQVRSGAWRGAEEAG